MEKVVLSVSGERIGKCFSEVYVVGREVRRWRMIRLPIKKVGVYMTF
jgi:hypothetical protein